jgi:integrase
LKGQRRIQYETVHGTRKEAEVALTKRLNEIDEGSYVPPSIETVDTYARHWLDNIAPASRSPISVARYRTLIESHIIPGLGAVELRALTGKMIDTFYASLRENGRRYGGGLSATTLRHVHTMLAQLLTSAVKAREITRSPMADIQTSPKPKRANIEVLNEAELATLIEGFRGRRPYMLTLLSAYTGLRRGEVLGLRWCNIDLVKGTLQVSAEPPHCRSPCHPATGTCAAPQRTG